MSESDEIKSVVEALQELSKKLDSLIDHQKTTWQRNVFPLTGILAATSRRTVLALEDLLAAGTPRHNDPLRVSTAAGQVFSQTNEDGVVAEIFRRIGTTTKKFLEIGVGHGTECTSRFLVELGWSGHWIQGGEAAGKVIATRLAARLSSRQLTLINDIITVENARKLTADIDGESLDYMSIDVDWNTYHIWRALDHLRPRVACIEFNAHFPPSVEWVAEYDPTKLEWDGTNWFGASLKSLELLGRAKGYCLVGCDLMGINSYFVRNDQNIDLFAGPFTAENHHEPPRSGVWGGSVRGNPRRT